MMITLLRSVGSGLSAKVAFFPVRKLSKGVSFG